MTNQDILNIRRRRSTGEPLYSIADSYGVSISCISRICAGKAFKDSPGPIIKQKPYQERVHLTPQDIEIIRARRASGEMLESIADDFDCHRETIRRKCQHDPFDE